jgi:hypothetical protein
MNPVVNTLAPYGDPTLTEILLLGSEAEDAKKGLGPFKTSHESLGKRIRAFEYTAYI